MFSYDGINNTICTSTWSRIYTTSRLKTPMVQQEVRQIKQDLRTIVEEIGRNFTEVGRSTAAIGTTTKDIVTVIKEHGQSLENLSTWTKMAEAQITELHADMKNTRTQQGRQNLEVQAMRDQFAESINTCRGL